MSKVIDVMNDKIQLDLDAMVAYDKAIEACDNSEVKAALAEFRSDHVRHVQDLSEAVLRAGAEPQRTRDLKGFVIQGFTEIVSHGDRSALMAMRGNEELTNRLYEAALKRDLTPDVRALLEKNLADERRHLAWIKDALDRRIWEREQPGAPYQP
jgi:rubrerythrin